MAAGEKREKQDWDNIADSAIMTVKEVAAYLRIHNTTIYRLLKNNSLPAFRIGSDWRFTKGNIDAWRKAQEVQQCQVRPNIK